MQAPVCKEERESGTKRDVELPCFAPRGFYVQKNLPFILSEREGEHVCRVRFLTVCAIDLSGKRIAAEHERKIIACAENRARNVVERNVWCNAADGLSYLDYPVSLFSFHFSLSCDRRPFAKPRCLPARAPISSPHWCLCNLTLLHELLVLCAAFQELQRALLLYYFRCVACEVTTVAGVSDEPRALHAPTEFPDEGKRGLVTALLDFCVYRHARHFITVVAKKPPSSDLSVKQQERGVDDASSPGALEAGSRLESWSQPRARG